ncbi:hypothetical protein FOA52_013605 [Chlamydomonas sp. UWO 241]|nr:hypothetical protein FOA52_013605 [Chlamydomonas sp. UWO 241]
MQTSVEATARVRVPRWLRLADVAILTAAASQSCVTLCMHGTADSLFVSLAFACVVSFVYSSSRFSLEMHTGVPHLFVMSVVAVNVAAELAWSWLVTGHMKLTAKPLVDAAVRTPGKLLVGSVFMIAYQVVTSLCCTSHGPSRHAHAWCQVWANVAHAVIFYSVIAAQAAFGVPFNASVSYDLANAVAFNCGAPLLQLLLTPAAAPPRAASKADGKSTPKLEPTTAPPVAAPPTDDTPIDARVSASAPANAPSSAGTRTPARARADAAAVGTRATSDGAHQPKYCSRLLSHSVPFTVKFPTLHLAEHPCLATPEGREALRAHMSASLSERASVMNAAPVALRLVTLNIGAGCVVAHGWVFGERDGAGGMVGSDEVAAMLRGVGASDTLMRMLPEGARLFDGDTAVLQLGDGTLPMEMAYSAAGGRFIEAPRSMPPPTPRPGVPLLSVTWPLLALPCGGSGCVHLQFGTALLARSLGHDPELVVSWVPSGASAAPTPLVRERVAALQAAARARGNPPGLIDIDVDLGPRPSHGVFIAQLVDGDALLDAHSVALLPASAQPVVAELLRARLAPGTLHAVALDLGVLLCGPRVCAPGDAAELRPIVRDLMAWEGTYSPALPALHALLGGLLCELDDRSAEQEASPSCSSPVTSAADMADASTPSSSPPLLFWCWIYGVVCAMKAAQFGMDGSGAAALAMVFQCLPYALAVLPANTRLYALVPRALLSIDGCAARRVYSMALALVATIPATGDLGRWTAYCKYSGDIPLMLLFAWCEPPRSPAVGAAISLLVELPVMCLFRWHALAGNGKLTSADQALAEFALRALLLAAAHVAVWWTPSKAPAGTRAGRATKLKVA